MKQQILSFVSAMLLAASAFPVCAQDAPDEQPTDANNITQTCTITASENQESVKNLADGSTKTVWKGNKGATLTVNCPDEIGSVYIEWDRSPVSFTVSSTEDSKDTVNGGDDGFLDEYVSLVNPVHTLTITLGDKAGVIDDIYFFGTGDIPSWVQRWQPMLDKADMLVFIAHADDEFLWFGGTIPVYAGEYHKKVQVAYLIHHGYARNEYFRNHELLNALWKAGVTNYPMISNFEDYYSKDLNKELKLLGEDAVLKYTVTLLRRFKPDVVVTHDVNGEYGHGAHKLCAYAMQKSIPLSSDASVYPDIAEKYGTWNIKKCYIHLYPENPIVMDWSEPLDAFGGKTGFDMAKLCYQCNVSQLKKVYRVAEAGSPYDSRKFGLYYSTVGPDINKNDFFENIAPVIPTTTATKNTTNSNASASKISPAINSQITDTQDSETIASIEDTMDNNDTALNNITSINSPSPRSPYKTIKTILILSGIAVIIGAASVGLILNRRHHYRQYKF